MKKKIEIVKACLANNLSYKDTAEHFLNAQVNHKCVYRLMQLLDLKAVICRKRYTYKPHKPQHIADNILNREFQADYNAMEVLLTDITEFKYWGHSKAYLSAVLDYGENKIVAYKLSRHNNALVRDTVTQIEDTIIPMKTLFHSDRGFQYMELKNLWKNTKLSKASRVGKCIDNGPMENFWGIIKEEMYRLTIYNTFEELEKDIKAYIEFYNTKRVTLKMGLRIPA